MFLHVVGEMTLCLGLLWRENRSLQQLLGLLSPFLPLGDAQPAGQPPQQMQV